MSIFSNIKCFLSPPTINDPDFGKLVFCKLKDDHSYWAGEWTLPGKGIPLRIELPGDKDGLLPDASEMLFRIANNFNGISASCRPFLESAFQELLQRPLPQLAFLTVLKPDVLRLEHPSHVMPDQWTISFVKADEPYLAVVIWFANMTPQEECFWAFPKRAYYKITRGVLQELGPLKLAADGLEFAANEALHLSLHK